MLKSFCVVGAILLMAGGLLAQAPGQQQIVVTVLPHGDHAVPALMAANFMLRQSDKDDAVLAVQPAAGDAGAMELYLLFDRDLGNNLTPLLGVVREFVKGLPPNVRVGFGYLRIGGTQLLLQPTADHGAAAEAIVVPQGGDSPSPFESMGALVSIWKPQANVRHEIVVFTDGETPIYTNVGDNPIVGADNPIIRSLLPFYAGARVVVYGVFVPGAKADPTATQASKRGRNSATPQNNSAWLGQGNLQALAAATGGQAYWRAGLTESMLREDLQDVGARLNNQYLVTFQPTAVKTPGGVSLKVTVKAGDGQVWAPKMVVVP